MLRLPLNGLMTQIHQFGGDVCRYPKPNTNALLSEATARWGECEGSDMEDEHPMETMSLTGPITKPLKA